MKRMIICLLALLMLTVACQTTPNVPVVVPKDQEVMIGKAENEPKPEADEIPSHYTFAIEDGAFSVSIDADVVVPSTDLPVLRVAAQGFRQETVTNVFNYWFANANETVWHLPKYNERTKAEIEPDLQQAYQLMETKEYLEWGDWTEEEWQEHVAYLEEAYRNAPEEHSAEPYADDGTLKTEEGWDGVYHVQAGTDSGTHLSVNSEPTGTHPWNTSSLWAVVADVHYPSYMGLNQKRVDASSVLPKELTITYADAVKLGDAFAAATGEPMRLHSAFLIDDEQDGHLDDLVQPAESYAFQLFYTRVYNGAPLSYDASGSLASNEQYSLTWGLEYLEIIIDNNGIQEAHWQEPLTVTDTVVEHCTLLPFSQILEMSERLYPIIYKTRLQNDESGAGTNRLVIHVDRIALELMRIREQNVTDKRQGLLVPTWVFYGTIRADRVDSEGYTWSSYTYFHEGGGSDWPAVTPVFAINAIDGSLIDPTLGY